MKNNYQIYVKFLDYFRQTMSAIMSKLQLCPTFHVSKFYSVSLSMDLEEEGKAEAAVIH